MVVLDFLSQSLLTVLSEEFGSGSVDAIVLSIQGSDLLCFLRALDETPEATEASRGFETSEPTWSSVSGPEKTVLLFLTVSPGWLPLPMVAEGSWVLRFLTSVSGITRPSTGAAFAPELIFLKLLGESRHCFLRFFHGLTQPLSNGPLSKAEEIKSGFPCR